MTARLTYEGAPNPIETPDGYEYHEAADRLWGGESVLQRDGSIDFVYRVGLVGARVIVTFHGGEVQGFNRTDRVVIR